MAVLIYFRLRLPDTGTACNRSVNRTVVIFVTTSPFGLLRLGHFTLQGTSNNWFAKAGPPNS